ncbi:YcaO-like family protein [Sulfolobus acidocaldarius]|uniref:YcaO domain-containing protein n=4 Tax=Sulfolobus acidocaldarius TaxID=2285 RepID=Q4JBA3_SULAC|nr:YcaO-like family protein [Sulfolobus acidocaldarius]AAY79926.1 hypothetical protein Saci_0526 [Sulfolobus acidocaldarius DSM 639]AGE70494.1 hypothetical protein SacN8_02580 [Sulfolobus acidocaldarius N8]AGE72767.1 hypothetical protein SacRon12I_02570 [Sulfolobus acidocaldarius Ron12/I]ALU29136.1 hypothetical protein ATY89_03720 [Sulfolobus acidocaldarius]ALU31862.1 hypothetical protein ATZ20_06745 [Sulfolobus acidocaldarius]
MRLEEFINEFIGPVFGYVAEKYDNVIITRLLNYVNYNILESHIGQGWIRSSIEVLTPPQVLPLLKYLSNVVPAGGKGFTEEESLEGAIGEFLERFYGAFTLFDDESIIFGRIGDLMTKYEIFPITYKFFSTEQLQKLLIFRDYNENVMLSLTRAKYYKGSDVYIPVQITYLLNLIRPGEDLIAYSTTGGLAFHKDFESAFIHGLLEYLERDTINISWISRIPPKRIRLPERIRRKLKVLEDRNITCLSFPGEFKGLFVVGCLGFINDLYVAGAGADITLEEAIRKAVFEVYQSISSFSKITDEEIKMARNLKPDYLTDFGLVPLYYSFVKTNFLVEYLRSLQSITYEELEREENLSYKSLIDIILGKNYYIIYKDFDIEKYLGEGKLVRVIVPDLTPAHIPNLPFLGHKRYYTIRKEFNLSNVELFVEEPVPFP